MNAASPDRRLSRLQLTAAVVALLVSGSWLGASAILDPDVPFLTTTAPTWITPAAAPDSNAIRVDLEDVPEVVFTRRFEVAVLPQAARIEARALRQAEYLLNGVPLALDGPRPKSWKRHHTLSARAELREGENELRVRVRNAHGPAVLQLRLTSDDGSVLLETDTTWTTLRSSPQGLARAGTMEADDTRPHPQSLSVPSTVALLRENAAILALCFLIGALLHLTFERFVPSAARAHTPEIVLAAATLFWVAVYSTRTSQLPVLMGFDIVGHLEYIDFLREQKRLPLATDGWSTYHPPLAYLLTSLVTGAVDLGRESAAARWLYRLPMFLAGLGNVWIAYAVSRRLFRRDPLRTSLAVAFAALLPMNVYMSAYVSNEPLHSFLVSLSLLIACNLLQLAGSPPRRVAALALTLGLAILTKFTSLVVVPLAALLLGVKLWLVDRLDWWRNASISAALLVGVASVGGWFYLRNWLRLGRPVVGNWDLPGNLVWWEQPGFHTLDYYTSFGFALHHPFFAGYHSFWDGIYSTFWGDGLVAGMIRLATRHEAWNYEFMTLGYLLALPATLLLLVGFARALRFCGTGREAGPRLAMSLLIAFLYALCFALLAITLRLPYYAQAKAFYVLSAIVPLALVAALGLAWLPERLIGRRWLPLRMLYSGWLCTLAAVLVLSFLG